MEGQSSPFYAIELDLDRDGRGDWLFMVEGSLPPEWTIDGMRAWQDAKGVCALPVTPTAAPSPTPGSTATPEH